MLNRRDVLKKMGLVIVAPFAFTRLLTAQSTPIVPAAPFKRPLTITQIIQVSYDAVRNEMLRGGSWATQELRNIHNAGRIDIRPLGPCLVGAGTGKHYAISDISVPIVWARTDEARCTTEKDKIDLTRNLLVNAFESMDDIIIEKIGTGKAVASDIYRYERSHVVELPHTDSFMFKLYTAIAFIE